MTDQPSKESLERARAFFVGFFGNDADEKYRHGVDALALEFDTIIKERDDALIRANSGLELVRLRQQNAALVGALQWTRDYIQDGLETPSHNCEYFSNPEKGSCDFCEKWVDVQTTLAPYAPSEEKEKA